MKQLLLGIILLVRSAAFWNRISIITNPLPVLKIVTALALVNRVRKDFHYAVLAKYNYSGSSVLMLR